ncbi:MAG: tetratricopeptide repeat protein [Nevskia sp.]|nr:tetratricopeptide repeat protein [Nevskia sp.]
MLQGLLAWLLLPLGLALGWALARARRPAPAGPAAAVPAQVAPAETDDGTALAIEALGRAAAAEPGAVELQLTLGAMFRRRGEVERAIRVHEALLGRPGLSAVSAGAVRVELAQDFLKAGLLDRAEALLEELEGPGPQAAPALELLLEIHEQTRDWVQAVQTARRLQAVKGSSAAPRIAHYWCEQAEAARAAGDTAAAARLLETALEEDRDCVRASMLQGALLEAAKDSRGAIKAYWRSMQQDGSFFAEVAPAMERCCREAADADTYAGFLAEAEASLKDSPAPALAKARWLQLQGQPVRGHLGAALAHCPTREGVLLWVRGGAGEPAPESLQAFAQTLAKSLKARPRFVCKRCGLQPSVLFWQCPKCRTWGSVAPADERL